MADIVFPKPSASEASSKIDKVQNAVVGNIAALGVDGSLVDSGKTIEKSVPSNAVFTDTTYSFSNNNPTLSWNTTSTIGTVGSTALTVQMPPNPDTNTTYSFTNNGPTLAWNTTSTIGVCGGVALTAKLPANPNTDHYAWSDITNKPETATRWPAWSEVTGKPSEFTPSDNSSYYMLWDTGQPGGSGTAAAATKTYWTNNIPKNRIVGAYNSVGTEYSILFSKGGSDTVGSVLKWGYNNKYLWILRQVNGWQSDDWEKISAGYADSAGSVVWGNVTNKPSTYAPSAHTHPYNEVTNAPSTRNRIKATPKAGGRTTLSGRTLVMHPVSQNQDTYFYVTTISEIPEGDYIFSMTVSGMASGTTWGFGINGQGSGYTIIAQNGRCHGLVHLPAKAANQDIIIDDYTRPTGSDNVYFYDFTLVAATWTDFVYAPEEQITTLNIGSQSVNYASSAGSVSWSNVSGRPSVINNLSSSSTTDALSAKQGSVLASLIPGIETMTVGPGVHATMPWSGSSNQAAIVFWYHSSAALNPQAIWMNSTVHVYNMSGIDCGTITMDSTTFVNGTDYWLYVIFFNLKHGAG